WNVLEELLRPETTRRWRWLGPGLALVAGIAIARASWIVWPMLCFACVHWENIPSVVRVHHIALVEGGIAVALPCAGVLAIRALRPSIDVAGAALHRWVAGLALFLFIT